MGHLAEVDPAAQQCCAARLAERALQPLLGSRHTWISTHTHTLTRIIKVFWQHNMKLQR